MMHKPIPFEEVAHETRGVNVVEMVSTRARCDFFYRPDITPPDTIRLLLQKGINSRCTPLYTTISS
ncbi:hypothetical protein [Bacteroides heparinolyticus]|uniref:hypothetical protein n=1 Tax=Prevotella heparinolytica TaxID=28113 RepID=UPI0035A0BDCA